MRKYTLHTWKLMLFAQLPRTKSANKWTLWSGSILPCFHRNLTLGNPYLVALCYRCHGHGRLIVRVQWNDGSVWVAKTFDAPAGIAVDTDEALFAWSESQIRPLVKWWLKQNGPQEFARKEAA